MTALFSDPGAAAKKQAQIDRIQEQQRQDSITSGTNAINDTFTPFNSDFYNARGKAYTDYANPQLDQQYNDAKQQLTYSLARAGALDSSARASQEAKLQQTYDSGKQQVQNAALDYENQAKTGVESARSNLLSTLNSTGNASLAANSALGQAQALSAPASYSPLGQLFTSFTSGLGSQAAAEKASLAGGTLYQSPYTTGLFSNASAVKKTA